MQLSTARTRAVLVQVWLDVSTEKRCLGQAIVDDLECASQWAEQTCAAWLLTGQVQIEQLWVAAQPGSVTDLRRIRQHPWVPAGDDVQVAVCRDDGTLGLWVASEPDAASCG